jgi:hypothetical protein
MIIELENGKYTVIFEEYPADEMYGHATVKFHALRYGERWRNLIGDGLVLAMAQRIEELEEKLESYKSKDQTYEESIDNDIDEYEESMKGGVIDDKMGNINVSLECTHEIIRQGICQSCGMDVK